MRRRHAERPPSGRLRLNGPSLLMVLRPAAKGKGFFEARSVAGK
jgi:hypothetical protein